MESSASKHPADETLVSYGLGKLDDTLAERVSTHLEHCAPCRQRVGNLSADSFLGRLREAQLRPGEAGLQSGAILDPQPPHRTLASGKQPSAAIAPASNVSLPPELVNHPQYEVIRELGRGGMGVVYLARNKLMDRLEVLKVLNKDRLSQQETVERFEREIQSAAKLHHPNVVAAYTAFPVGDALAFAMEFVDGVDLEKLVRDRGPLPVNDACYFTCQAAQGLQHAHERGMIHRDIKPGNLILCRQGKKAVVKILDFGLAKLADLSKVATGRDIDPTLTQDGYVLGTPDYVAPEQALDPRGADIRADIYSLGCTLYTMLAGGPPFRGRSVQEILRAHQSVEAAPLRRRRPDVPAKLAAAVAKMMAKDPNRRYQTPAEVVQALKPFLKQGGMPKPQLSPRKGAPKIGRSAGAPQPSNSLVETALDGELTAVIPRVGRLTWYRVAWVLAVTVLGIGVAWYGGAFAVKTRENVARLQERIDQQGRPAKTPIGEQNPGSGTRLDFSRSRDELGIPFGKPQPERTVTALAAPKVAQPAETSPGGKETAGETKDAKVTIEGTGSGNGREAKASEPPPPYVMIENMKVETLRAGKGEAQTKTGDFLTVNYANMFVDRRKIDSTYDRGRRPLTFKLGTDRVLEGWHVGLVGMKVGEKRRLTIPPELAFGSAGSAPAHIPPNATLISEIELLELVPGAR